MSEKVSILIPVYNTNTKLLERCLKSVFEQTYQNFQILLLDDGSLVDQADLIKERFDSEERIVCYKNEKNMGRGYSRQKLIEYSDTKLSCWLDADDHILPDKLEKQIKYFEEHPDCNFLATEMMTFYKNGHSEPGCNKAEHINNVALEELKKVNCINNPTVMFKTAAAKDIGYNSIYTYNEDWYFWIAAYEKGYKVECLPEMLYSYNG